MVTVDLKSLAAQLEGSIIASTLFAGAVVTLSVLWLNFYAKWSPARTFMIGLTSFRPSNVGNNQQAASAPPPKKKAAKKMEKLRKEQFAKGVENPMMKSVTDVDLVNLEYRDDFDSLVLVCTLTVINVGAQIVGVGYFGFQDSMLMIHLSLVMILAAAYYMAKAGVLDASTQRKDQALVVIVTALSMVLAFGVLMLAPSHIIDMNLKEGAQDLSETLTKIVKSRLGGQFKTAQGEEVQFEIPVSPTFMALMTALLAAGLSGQLLLPALRYARLLFSAGNVPLWGQELLSLPSLTVAGMQLSYALTALVCCLWFPPLTEVVRVNPRWLGLLQPGGLLVLGVLYFLVLRGFIQTHLNQGLIEWYWYRYNGKMNDEDRAFASAYRLQFYNRKSCKAALQLVAVPVVLVIVGAVLMMKTVRSLRVEDAPWQAPAFFQCFCGFLGLWTCFSWWLYSTIFLWLVKVGVMV